MCTVRENWPYPGKLNSLGMAKLPSLLPRVHKHEHSILSGLVERLLVADYICNLLAFDSLLRHDADELPLLKTPGPVCADILVIGQHCRQPNESNVLQRLLHGANCSCNSVLQHRSTLVV